MSIALDEIDLRLVGRRAADGRAHLDFLGVDLVFINQQARHHLAALFGQRRRCLFCAERQRCERWLASGATEGYREFCPNASSFERMQKRA